MFENYSILQNDNNVAEVNMAPLIDMVFILLIFFIVTTNFNRQTGVDVSKPKATSAISTGQKTMMIGVTREGTIHVYGRQVGIERLGSLVEQEIQRHPDMSIVIVADRDASIGKAVQIMDQCAQSGAQKVSIAADKESQ